MEVLNPIVAAGIILPWGIALLLAFDDCLDNGVTRCSARWALAAIFLGWASIPFGVIAGLYFLVKGLLFLYQQAEFPGANISLRLPRQLTKGKGVDTTIEVGLLSEVDDSLGTLALTEKGRR